MSEAYLDTDGDRKIIIDAGSGLVEVNLGNGNIESIDLSGDGGDEAGDREPRVPQDPMLIGGAALDTPKPAQNLNLTETSEANR